MKKIVLPFLLSILLVLSFGPSAFAANLGQSLKFPEDGWNRFDDNNSKFIYTGAWETNNSGSAAWYGGGVKYFTFLSTCKNSPSTQTLLHFHRSYLNFSICKMSDLVFLGKWIPQ